MDRLITQSGLVRAIVGDQAQVVVATTGCASCGHAGGCGIGKLAGGRRETLISLPAAGLHLGQRVTLELPEKQLTQAALFGYLLPAVTLLMGALIGEKVDAGETAAVLGAGIGLLAGLFLTRLRRPLSPRLTQEHPHV